MKLKTLCLLLIASLTFTACTLVPEIPPTPTLEATLPVAGAENMWQSTDYQGKPILMAIMASWCPWCKRSLAALDSASAAFAGRVEVVGVFVDEDPAAVEQVQKEFQMQTKALYHGGEIAEEMGIGGFPYIMLFDQKHRLVKVWSGYSENLAQEYQTAIQKLLK